MTRYNVIVAFNEFLLNLYLALGSHETKDFIKAVEIGQDYFAAEWCKEHGPSYD